MLLKRDPEWSHLADQRLLRGACCDRIRMARDAAGVPHNDRVRHLDATRSAWHPVPGASAPTRGDFDDLRALVAGGGVVVLSGAGLSTESGIPDYRGPDGRRRVTPMTIAQFRHDPDGRRRYWSRAFVGWDTLRAAAPNSGHAALARLEAAGLIDHVITQNVDGLHQQAGSRRVTELHGTLTRVVCLHCGARLHRDRVQAALARINPDFGERARSVRGGIRPDGDVELPADLIDAFRVMRCEECGGDQLKPDVVFFGESAAPEVVARCYAAVESASALLVVGSSLAVMSGLRFVRRAAALGHPIAIVTNGPTRGDELATVRLAEPLGQVLPRLADALPEAQLLTPVAL